MKVPQSQLLTELKAKLGLLGRYRVLIFIVVVVAVYGYLLFQINSAANVQPSQQDQVVTTTTPHIDPSVVQQLQQLQDNSVSVQSLFNQSRTNPFQ